MFIKITIGLMNDPSALTMINITIVSWAIRPSFTHNYRREVQFFRMAGS